MKVWRGAQTPRRPSATRRLQQSERDWQRQVIAAAELHGWRCWHDYDSRRNTAGWPDLVLCHPPRLDRPGRALFVELKTATGRVSPTQQQWLDLLAACGLEVDVWRPADWPRLLALLAGE